MIKVEADRFESVAPLWKLWWIFFAYAAVVALMIQLVILPYVFPAWHMGNGLLIGGDWLSYHRIAVELADKINGEGWSAWVLRPEGQAPAGIAGAIYALIIPQPWTVIPVNAALHATAGIILLQIMRFFITDWRRAIWPVMPFLLYPSAMTWYTQILKDGYFIAGSFLFIYGWLSISNLEKWRADRWYPLKGLAFIFLGAALVWIVRPYGVQMMQVVSIIMALLLSGLFLSWGAMSRLTWRRAAIGLLVGWMAVVMITPLGKGGIYMEAPAGGSSVEAPTGGSSAEAPAEKPGTESYRITFYERFFSRVTSFINNKVYTLSSIRLGFITGYPDAGSNIDTQVEFRKLSDIAAYLPRAGQISFLAPFPNHWFGSGTLEANTMMRRISAVEMIGVYIALAFLPVAVWYWRRRVEIWLIIVFSGGMMLIYGLVVPNIGTLYRWRYGYIMLLVALGVAGFISVLQKHYANLSQRRNSNQNHINTQGFSG